LAIFSAFEREILRERVRAGLAQARQNGQRLGRPVTAALHADKGPEALPCWHQQIRDRPPPEDRAHLRAPHAGSKAMKRPKKDPIREDRIHNEAIVNAYRPEEQALGWYYYLENKIRFPFRAKCIVTELVSPLVKGETVESDAWLQKMS